VLDTAALRLGIFGLYVSGVLGFGSGRCWHALDGRFGLEVRGRSGFVGFERVEWLDGELVG